MSEKKDFLIVRQIIEATDEYKKKLVDYKAKNGYIILYPNPGCFADFALITIAFLAVGYNCRLATYISEEQNTYALLISE